MYSSSTLWLAPVLKIAIFSFYLCTLASVYDDLRQHLWLYYLLSDHRCLCAISLASRAVVLCLVICECERSSEAQPVWVRTRPARGRIVGSAGGFWKTKHCHLLMLLAAVSVVTHQKQTHTHTQTQGTHTGTHNQSGRHKCAPKPLTKYPSTLSQADRLT